MQTDDKKVGYGITFANRIAKNDRDEDPFGIRSLPDIPNITNLIKTHVNTSTEGSGYEVNVL